MELGLLQLAIAHLASCKAAKAAQALGSRAQSKHRNDCTQIKAHSDEPPNRCSSSMQGSRRKWLLTSARARTAAPRAGASSSSIKALPFATTSPGRNSLCEPQSPHQQQQQQQRAQPALQREHVPHDAWALPRRESAGCAATLPWASRLCGKGLIAESSPPRSVRRWASSDKQRCTEGRSQSAGKETSSYAAFSPPSRISWLGSSSQQQQPQRTKGAAMEPPLEGWRLDDDPEMAAAASQRRLAWSRSAVSSVATAVSAVAGRVFGGGGGATPNGPAVDAATGDDLIAPGDDDCATPFWRTTTTMTPHLVGSHALGAGGGSWGSGGTAAAAAGGSRPPAAAAAAALSSASDALGDLAERAVEAPVRGLRQLNQAVTAGLNDFLASESGRRLSEQVAAEMNNGVLMAPVYLTEELVKARLMSMLRSHALFLATFFAVRVSLATAALHGAKALARRSVSKRNPRWLRGAVHFLTDVILPTGFFGPLLGITAGVMQLTGVRLGAEVLGAGLGPLLRRGGGGRGGHSAVPVLHMQPHLAAALPAATAAASDAVAATVAATVAPVAAAASVLRGGVVGGAVSIKK